MARKAKVNYWASRGAFGCWVRGVQEILAKGPDDRPDGPVYKAALRRQADLLTGTFNGPTLAQVVAEYLTRAVYRVRPKTLKLRQDRLAPVVAEMGSRPAASLTAHDFERWCDEQRKARGWGDGTVRLTLVSVKAALRWAVKKKLLASHALEDMEIPPDRPRGEQYVLTEEQERLVLSISRGRSLEFLQALRDTGARPSEVAAAEPQNYNPALGAIVFHASPAEGQFIHKTARTGEDRVIFLRGKTLAAVQGLMIVQKDGPIFRTNRAKMIGPNAGQPWSWEVHNIESLFCRLRRRTGIKNLIAYSFRHTFAVRALNAGVPIEVLAKIMGTSIKMIERHYGHLAKQTKLLRAWVDKLPE